jgi:hypothetical protein
MRCEALHSFWIRFSIDEDMPLHCCSDEGSIGTGLCKKPCCQRERDASGPYALDIGAVRMFAALLLRIARAAEKRLTF